MGLFSKKKKVLPEFDRSCTPTPSHYAWLCCHCRKAGKRNRWTHAVVKNEYEMCTMKCSAVWKYRVERIEGTDPSWPDGGCEANGWKPTIKYVPDVRCDHVPYYCLDCKKKILRSKGGWGIV